MDAFEAKCERFAPVGASAEAGDDFDERSLVNASRQVARFGEFR